MEQHEFTLTSKDGKNTCVVKLDIQLIENNTSTGSTGSGGSSGSSGTTGPNGNTGTTRGRNFDKVLYIVMENQDYSDAINNTYLKNLAQRGVSFSNFWADGNPSYPNYLAMVAGSTFNVDSNDQITIDAKTIVDLLEPKGLTWKAYGEDYPGNGFLGDDFDDYARKHFPFLSFKNIQANPSRLSKNVNASQFQQDLNNLPNYALYIPNNLNNGHDTSLSYGANWLQGFLEPVLNNSTAMNGTLVVVTYDEGNDDNHIYTVLLGSMVKAGTVISTKYDHYDLLKLIEDNFSLGNLGKQDAVSQVINGIWKDSSEGPSGTSGTSGTTGPAPDPTFENHIPLSSLPGGMTLKQADTILQLVSLPENSDPKWWNNYNYAENLHDGRGITFSICGFCSGTGDGILVLLELQKINPNHKLCKYIPAMKKTNGSNVTGLSGFISDVKSLGDDKEWQTAVWRILIQLYWGPGMQLAAKYGCKLPITKGEIYDSMINHGDTDSLEDMIDRIRSSPPSQGGNEITWLNEYLTVRRRVITVEDTSLDDGQPDRVDLWKSIISKGNYNLDRPLRGLICYGESFDII